MAKIYLTEAEAEALESAVQTLAHIDTIATVAGGRIKSQTDLVDALKRISVKNETRKGQVTEKRKNRVKA